MTTSGLAIQQLWLDPVCTLHTLMDEMAQREIFFKEDDDLNYDQDALNRTASKDPSSS